jgi:hypothetical protein
VPLSGLAMLAIALAVGVAARPASGAKATGPWTLAESFSPDANPSGDWSWGQTNVDGALGSFEKFPLHILSNGCPAWCVSATADGSQIASACVSKNVLATTLAGIKPGEVAFHPGPDSHKAVVRWTSPIAGPVAISGSFGQGDKASVNLYIARTDGKGTVKDTLFTALDTGSTEKFDLNTTVAAGETIDFAIGRADQWDHAGTPLAVVIKPGTGDAAKPGSDALLGLADEQLFGTVLSMDSHGLIEFTSPLIEGRVKIRAAALDSIRLGGTEVEPVQHRVRLSTGESIVGNLVSVKNDAIALETHAAGRLTFPRAVVTSVVLAAQGTESLVTDLASGDLGAWQMKPGDWVLRRGRLVAARTSAGPLWVKADMKGPYTLVAVMHVAAGAVPSCLLRVGTDAPNATSSGVESHVEATVGRDQAQIRYQNQNSGGSMGGGGYNIRSTSGTATVRFTCDPATRSVSLWVDNQQLFSNMQLGFNLGDKLFASFAAREPLEIESLAFLPGILGLPASPTGTAKTGEGDSAAIEFTNGDRLQFRHLLLDDGKFTVAAVAGNELTVAEDLVARITFGKSTEKPADKPAAKPAAKTETTGGARVPIELTPDQKTALEKPVADFEKATEVFYDASVETLGEQQGRRFIMMTVMQALAGSPASGKAVATAADKPPEKAEVSAAPPPAGQPAAFSVMVQSAVGRFVCKVKSLNADTFVGVSDTLGEVRIRRAAIRELTMREVSAPATVSGAR